MAPHPSKPLSATLAHLATVEDYLQHSANPQNTGWYVRDLHADVHYWSPEVFAWFGLPVEERAPGVGAFRSLLSPTSVSSVFAAFERWRAGCAELVVEYDVRRRDGSRRRLRSFGRTLRRAGSDHVSMIGTVMDLTGYACARDALAEATSTLRGAELIPVAPAGRAAPRAADLRTASSRRDGGLAPRQLTCIRELIEARIRERVSVGELAAAVRLSEAHFIRAFKQTTGVTPHRYIVERKLELARASLLDDREQKVAAIAIDFGFFDQSHFTRQFRRRFGCTPGDVLRSLRRESRLPAPSAED